jgi:NTP pyrophosphatase (non-canonical NTP hydrolase)
MPVPPHTQRGKSQRVQRAASCGLRWQVAEEAADVLISLLNLCEAAGIDLAAATEAKIARNAEKYPVERAAGRLEKYDELE